MFYNTIKHQRRIYSSVIFNTPVNKPQTPPSTYSTHRKLLNVTANYSTEDRRRLYASLCKNQDIFKCMHSFRHEPFKDCVIYPGLFFLSLRGNCSFLVKIFRRSSKARQHLGKHLQNAEELRQWKEESFQNESINTARAEARSLLILNFGGKFILILQM